MAKLIRRTACPRKQAGFESGKGLEYCVAAHGEANAIAQAARMGVAIRGSQMVIYGGVPCKNCAVLIVNSGILEVYCASGDVTYDSVAEEILKEAGVKLYKLDIIGMCIHNREDERTSPDSKVYSLVNIAKVISLNSKCMSRKVGSIIVRDGCIISTGYNGPARRASHCDKRTYGLPPGCDELCVNCHKDPAKCEESSLYEGELTPTSVRLSAIREGKRKHDEPGGIHPCRTCKGKGLLRVGVEARRCEDCNGTGWADRTKDVPQGSVDPV